MANVGTAIIPIGGVGSRLYPLTVDTSKAMVRFLTRPLLDFIVTMLAVQGIRVVYMGVSGYHNYVQVYDYFGSGRVIAQRLGLERDEFRIRYMPNIISRGNAEAILTIVKYYRIDEPFIVAQCDNVFDGLDIQDLAEYTLRNQCDMTIVLYEVEEPKDIKRFGVAELREDGLLARFVEKPKTIEEAPSRLINTGIYMINPSSILDFFDSGQGKKMYEDGLLDFGRHVIPSMIEQGYRICGYTMMGVWFDIGTPETYMEATFYFLRLLPTRVFNVDFMYGRLRVLGKSKLSREAQQKMVEMIRDGKLFVGGDVLVGRHTSIGSGVRLRSSVVDNYVVVSDDVIVEDSIVMDRVYIGRGARIRNSIIGRHSYIDEGAVIDNSIIGNNVFIGRGARVIDSKIWPGRYVPSHVTFTSVTLP